MKDFITARVLEWLVFGGQHNIEVEDNMSKLLSRSITRSTIALGFLAVLAGSIVPARAAVDYYMYFEDYHD